MNKGLLAFSILLIVVGALLGVGIIALIGIILLIPAAMSRSTKPTQTQNKTAPQQSRVSARQSSPARPVPQPWQQQAGQTGQPETDIAVEVVTQPMPRPTVSAGYGTNSALFATPMFPTFSQPYASVPASEERKREGEKERDELLEMALILGLLRLYSS